MDIVRAIIRPFVVSVAILALVIILVLMPEYEDYGLGLLFSFPLIMIIVFIWLHRNLFKIAAGFWKAALASVIVAWPYMCGLVMAMAWAEKGLQPMLRTWPFWTVFALGWGIPIYFVSPAIYTAVKKARLRQNNPPAVSL